MIGPYTHSWIALLFILFLFPFVLHRLICGFFILGDYLVSKLHNFLLLNVLGVYITMDDLKHLIPREVSYVGYFKRAKKDPVVEKRRSEVHDECFAVFKQMLKSGEIIVTGRKHFAINSGRGFMFSHVKKVFKHGILRFPNRRERWELYLKNGRNPHFSPEKIAGRIADLIGLFEHEKTAKGELGIKCNAVRLGGRIGEYIYKVRNLFEDKAIKTCAHVFYYDAWRVIKSFGDSINRAGIETQGSSYIIKSNRRHPGHLVSPSPGPFFASLSAFIFVLGFVCGLYRIDTTLPGRQLRYVSVLTVGETLLCFTMFVWFRDIIREGLLGYHTTNVVRSLRIGFILFLASEVMFFVSFFGAYFHISINPSIGIGDVWPPEGITYFFFSENVAETFASVGGISSPNFYRYLEFTNPRSRLFFPMNGLWEQRGLKYLPYIGRSHTTGSFMLGEKYYFAKGLLNQKESRSDCTLFVSRENPKNIKYLKTTFNDFKYDKPLTDEEGMKNFTPFSSIYNDWVDSSGLYGYRAIILPVINGIRFIYTRDDNFSVDYVIHMKSEMELFKLKVHLYDTFFKRSSRYLILIDRDGNKRIEDTSNGRFKSKKRARHNRGFLMPLNLHFNVYSRGALINPFKIPLLNTALLLSSGAVLTASHAYLKASDFYRSTWALVLTIILALLFLGFQLNEYIYSVYAINDTVYGAVFYLLTGFHGIHVIIGTVFLIVCLYRLIRMHFTPKNHFGFEAAIGYGHFVDVIGVFLYIFVYLGPGAYFYKNHFSYGEIDGRDDSIFTFLDHITVGIRVDYLKKQYNVKTIYYHMCYRRRHKKMTIRQVSHSPYAKESLKFLESIIQEKLRRQSGQFGFPEAKSMSFGFDFNRWVEIRKAKNDYLHFLRRARHGTSYYRVWLLKAHLNRHFNERRAFYYLKYCHSFLINKKSSTFSLFPESKTLNSLEFNLLSYFKALDPHNILIKHFKNMIDIRLKKFLIIWVRNEEGERLFRKLRGHQGWGELEKAEHYGIKRARLFKTRQGPTIFRSFRRGNYESRGLPVPLDKWSSPFYEKFRMAEMTLRVIYDVIYYGRSAVLKIPMDPRAARAMFIHAGDHEPYSLAGYFGRFAVFIHFNMVQIRRGKYAENMLAEVFVDAGEKAKMLLGYDIPAPRTQLRRGMFVRPSYHATLLMEMFYKIIDQGIARFEETKKFGYNRFLYALKHRYDSETLADYFMHKGWLSRVLKAAEQSAYRWADPFTLFRFLTPRELSFLLTVNMDNERVLDAGSELGAKIGYIANVYKPAIYRCYSPGNGIEKRFLTVKDLYKKIDLYEYNPLLEDVIKRKNKKPVF